MDRFTGLCRKVQQREAVHVSKYHAGLIIFFAMLEGCLFGFILDGWPSITYVLKSDGVFSYLCKQRDTSHLSFQNSDSSTYGNNSELISFEVTVGSDTKSISSYPVCNEQDQVLNEALLIALFVGNAVGVMTGYIFDHIGVFFFRLLTRYVTMFSNIRHED